MRRLAPLTLVMICTVLLAFTRTTLTDPPLQKGIALFKQAQYDAALEQLQLAVQDLPNDAYTNLWLGLALEANKRPYDAMAAWRVCYGNPKWEPVADYLKGLSWWRLGNTGDAIAYLKDAFINNRDGKAVTFKPATEAIQQINNGAPVPPISQWADLSTLTAPPLAKAVATPPAVAAQKGPAPQPVQVKEEAKKVTPPVAPGASPKSGKWVAAISNGYKGDVLTFTVSADGKRIENVEFVGHWRSRSGRTEVLMDLDPPNPFAVANGLFSAVQQVPASGMWWEFTGRFTSATTAEGSYRTAFAGGENDTYKLKWTAKRVGS